MAEAKRRRMTASRASRSTCGAQRLKSTAQRDTIAKVFLEHAAPHQRRGALQEVKRRNPRIGYATVYRTMKLLTECGLAVERHFRDGEARYESGQKSTTTT